MKFRLKSRQFLLACTSVAVVAGASLASAAWLTSGSGDGAATAGSANGLTVASATVSPSTLLYPGASGDVVVSVENTNGFPVKITAIDLQDGQSITADENHSDCTTTGVTYTAPSDFSDAQFTIPANTTQDVVLDASVDMDNSSVDACQGAGFTVPLTVSAESAAS